VEGAVAAGLVGAGVTVEDAVVAADGAAVGPGADGPPGARLEPV
jgi:hypothetical protein